MRRAHAHAAWLAVAALLLTVAVLLGWADPLDRALGGPLAAASPAWGAVTHLGDTLVLAAAGTAAALVLWARRGRVEGLVMAGLTGMGWVATWSLKYLIGRDRPEGILDPASPAFPSGHTLGATAVFVGAAVLAAPRSWPLVAAGAFVALVVGWSRLALGVHHVSDVLAGWLLGAALVILAHDLQASIRARPDAPPPGEGRPPGPRGPGGP